MAVGESETQCALARQAALADTEERAREWRAAEGSSASGSKGLRGAQPGGLPTTAEGWNADTGQTRAGDDDGVSRQKRAVFSVRNVIQ